MASLLLVLATGSLLAAASGMPGGDASGRPAHAIGQADLVGSPAGVTSGGDAGAVAGRVAVSPIIVRLELVPRRPKSKSPVEVRATVTNLSSTRLAEVRVAIEAAPAALVLHPADPKVVKGLVGGRSTDVTWTVCSTTGGTFQLIAAATVGGAPTLSPPLFLTIGAATRC